MKTTGKTVARVYIFTALYLMMGAVAHGQQAATARLTDTREGRRLLLLYADTAPGKTTLCLPFYGSITDLPTLRGPSFVGNDLGFLTTGGPSVFRQPIDPISPYRLQRERERKMHGLNVVLSAAVAVGACYMACQHVRRYGFWW